MEDHRRLAVADRRGRAGVARAERGEGEVVARPHVVGVLLEQVAPVLGPLALLLLAQVVGEVGGQPLAPVAADASGGKTPLPHQLWRISWGQEERRMNGKRSTVGPRSVNDGMP